MTLRTMLGTTALALGLAGCGNHFTPSPRMADAPPTLAIDPGSATMVFVRPSTYAGVINASLFVDGKYSADIEAQRRVAVQVAPGSHVLVASAGELGSKACRQMTATVEAGKIYFVHSSVAFGAELTAVRASDADKLRQWLEQAPSARAAASSVTAPLDQKELGECLQGAAKHETGEDAEGRAKHVLNAADGFAQVPQP